MSSTPEPPRAIRVDYRAWLDEIDDELVGGALLVTEALPRVTRAFMIADLACVDEARAVASETQERSRHVEDEGFLILAREAPVAGDLRRLVAILRLVTAVERSGVLIRHIAESLHRFDPRRLPEPLRVPLEELGLRSTDVFRAGVDAWRRRDGLAVHEVDRHDEAVDSLHRQVLRSSEELAAEPAELLVLGLVARYFERIADHGVSFARHATFAVTGERVDGGR